MSNFTGSYKGLEEYEPFQKACRAMRESMVRIRGLEKRMKASTPLAPGYLEMVAMIHAESTVLVNAMNYLPRAAEGHSNYTYGWKSLPEKLRVKTRELISGQQNLLRLYLQMYRSIIHLTET